MCLLVCLLLMSGPVSIVTVFSLLVRMSLSVAAWTVLLQIFEKRLKFLPEELQIFGGDVALRY